MVVFFYCGLHLVLFRHLLQENKTITTIKAIITIISQFIVHHDKCLHFRLHKSINLHLWKHTIQYKNFGLAVLRRIVFTVALTQQVNYSEITFISWTFRVFRG